MPPTSTPVRVPRIAQLTENLTPPPTSSSGRSPLGTRKGYNNTPIFDKKGKKDERGDKGKGKGVRAEQGKSREVPVKRVSSSIHLIGLPSPSLHALSRRLPNPFPPLAKISSQDQLYDDLFQAIGVQHTGDVSDSNIQAERAGEEGKYREYQGVGAGVEELDDIGDVSELLDSGEEEIVLGEQTQEEAEDIVPDVLRVTSTFISNGSTSSIRGRDDPANYIGQNGHVPRRVKEIETQHKSGQHLPITPPAKKQRTGTSVKHLPTPLPVESAFSAENGSEKSSRRTSDIITQVVGTALTNPPLVDNVVEPSTSGFASPFQSETPTSPVPAPSGPSIAHLVDMVDSLRSQLEATKLEKDHLQIENAALHSQLAISINDNARLSSHIENLDLTLSASVAENDQLRSELATTSLERDSMKTELIHVWKATREMDQTILKLEEEKKRLVMERKSAVADLEDLRKEIQIDMRETEGGSASHKDIASDDRTRGKKRAFGEVDDDNGDSDNDMVNRQTVETLRQAGMTSHDHWSNPTLEIALLKRKASVVMNTPSKRLRAGPV